VTVTGDEGLEGRIGLVLGAGGLVGHAWHAGVLAGLAEGLGWDPRTADVVVGTSAGSVVAAMLRGGLSAADVFARGDPG
jgi:NTE family protein